MKVYNYVAGAIGTNCYLCVDYDSLEAFIVDPGGYSDDLKRKVIEDKLDVKYIILTHGHGDHICAVNTYLELYPNSKLVASKEESVLLGDTNMNFSAQTCGVRVILKPDIEVSDYDTLPLGKHQIQFIMTPGHTLGGMCIYLKEHDILFSGDTLFANSIGRTDLPGGSFKQIKQSISEKLYVLPDRTRVYPGHMGETTIGIEKSSNPFV